MKNPDPSQGSRAGTLRGNLAFLKAVEKRLEAHEIPCARHEAESLVRHFAKLDRLNLFSGRKPISAAARKAVERALSFRIKGKPLAYLLKEGDFYGRKFVVTPDTLIPRPETEILVRETLNAIDALARVGLGRQLATNQASPSTKLIRGRVRQLCGGDPSGSFGPRVLDLCTGSGCIAATLTIERPEVRMTASDICPRALKIARKNFERHGLGNKARLVRSDLFERFRKQPAAVWDVIVSNPPYVASEEIPGLPPEVLAEPKLALDGGPDGLRVIDKILKDAPKFLVPGGWLLMEVALGHSENLRERLKDSQQFGRPRFVKDFAGIERIAILRRA